MSFPTLHETQTTYPTELSVTLHLDADEEHATVEEEQVALPPARIVVRLGVDSSRNGPDRCSSHICLIAEI